MNPILSIITINHNNAPGLERTILSIEKQVDRQFEYIVIDGGSTDGSKEIIEKYAGSITTWVTENDRGIYHAMNKGIAMSAGTYLLFLNSGDELNNDGSLQTAIKNLSGEDLIYCNILLVSEKSEILKKYPERLTFSYMLADSLPHPATFIRKQLFDITNGYDESLKICSDWSFFMRVLFKYDASYKHLDIILSRFYLGGISSSEQFRAIHLAERTQILETHFGRFAELIALWKEDIKLKTILKSSRLIKLARMAGFLKPLEFVDEKPRD